MMFCDDIAPFLTSKLDGGKLAQECLVCIFQEFSKIHFFQFFSGHHEILSRLLILENIAIPGKTLHKLFI